MASRLEEDLTCSICHELFTDPVLLSCSHSFCRVCLQNWWTDKPTKTCPICKKTYSSYESPPLSLALRNLVQTYTEEKKRKREEREQSDGSRLCRLHSEKLHLFCLDHEQPMCLVCRDSRTHKDHRFSPIEEAAEDLREQLRTSIRPLQDQLQVLTGRKQQFEEAAAHITAQARHTEAQIRLQFETLHQFLLEEECSRMKALREEEEKKTQRMNDKMAAVNRDIETVSKTISETEEQLRATDTSFLLQYKSTVERVQCCPLVEETKMERGALINQAKHVGNLSFKIWRNMKRLVQFYPLTLDPNTAGPELILSEDLSSVRRGERQRLPQNPDRCKDHGLSGCEVFRSGTHSWDVEVGESKTWAVGVGGHVLRGGETEVGVWGIGLIDGKYSSSNTDRVTPLSVRSLQRVRVKLDFHRKTLTFSDSNTNTDLLIFTITDTLTDGLTPYILTQDNFPLKILPKDVTVNV